MIPGKGVRREDEWLKRPPEPVQLNIPAIPLNAVAHQVVDTKEGGKAIILGPLCLVLPLDSEAVRVLHDALRPSGIEVPRIVVNGDAA